MATSLKARLKILFSKLTAAPTALQPGELAYSEASDKLFIGASNSIREIGGAGAFLKSQSPAKTLKGNAGNAAGSATDLTAAQTKTLLQLDQVQNLDTSTTANITDAPGKRFVNETEKSSIANLPTTYQKIATIGTEWLNLRAMSSWTGGTDITNALNEAINQVNARSPSGGQILIPRGSFTTNGRHTYGQTMQIRGAGYSLADGGATGRGTTLTLNGASPNNYFFLISGSTQNAGLYDIKLDGAAKGTNSIGLWISGTTNDYHLKTELESVFFRSCGIGIKNETAPGTNFQNDGFSAVYCSFQYCGTAFYCNSLNGSFYFYKPVIYLPVSGIAFQVPVVPTLIVEGHHIVGIAGYNAANQVNDNSIILLTGGQHNRIEFRDGQDEQVKYFHRDYTTNHYPGSPIVFRNNVIQSQFLSYAAVTYVIDSNYIVNHVNYQTFFDSPYGFVRIIKEGQNLVETRIAQPGPAVISGLSEQSNINYAPFYGTSALCYLTNPKSQVVDVRGHLRAPNSSSEPYVDEGTPFNKPYRMSSYNSISEGGYTTINSTLGTVNLAAGVTYFTVYNNTVAYNNANDCSIIDAFLEDEPNVRVLKAAANASGQTTYFTVFLSGATTAPRKLNFTVNR